MRFQAGGSIIAIIFLLFSAVLTAQTTPDPGLPGSYSVTKLEYDLGDLAVSLPGFPFPVEVRGSVHYPGGLTGGPYPVLVFLHGRHETCFQTGNPDNTNGDWPCASGFEPIVSYAGYDYLAEQMASHGYIVISISANAINADDASVWDYGMSGRAQLIQFHLDLWNDYNTIGGEPFGDLFIGKLDMNNIGTMGHSRGGEGVVANALLNRTLGSPYGIKAVLALAPVDFLREVLNGIPLMNIAPYCDGDVSDLQGVHYYDDARYADSTDQTPKYSVLMMGANHNFFNTVWTPGLYEAGSVDDWNAYYGGSVSHCGTFASDTRRLSPEEQQAALISYASAFFRVHIGHEMQFLPILTVDDIIPAASSMLEPDDVFVSYHAPDSLKTDINRITETGNLSINTLDASVTASGISDYLICGGDGESGCSFTGFDDKVPHESFSGGLSQQNIRWDDSLDSYTNELPAEFQDFTIYKSLQFRAAVNYTSSPEDIAQDFSVVLTDTTGNSDSRLVSDYSNVLYYPPGEQVWTLPKILFNTIKIPLTAFSGIDLRHISKVGFVFDATEEGTILISDMTLSGVRTKTTDTIPATVILTDIDDNYLKAMFVYPNPVTDLLSVDLNDISTEDIHIFLYNIHGEVIMSKEKISEITVLSLRNLAAGIYFLEVSSPYGMRSFKIVKD